MYLSIHLSIYTYLSISTFVTQLLNKNNDNNDNSDNNDANDKNEYNDNNDDAH
jgi:hypothetical protein